jgi:transcriptional regulator with AAA-type ATPase domain
MSTVDKTNTLTREGKLFGGKASLPGILVAHAPQGAVTVDRCRIKTPFTVGRSSSCDLPVREDKVSKRHLEITRSAEGFYIEDLSSTNGTFLNGHPLIHRRMLEDGAIIRIGQTVLVFHLDIRPMLETPSSERFGIVGRFHAAPYIRCLAEAACSGRHLLLAGPSGTGKELSAHAVARLLSPSDTPLKMIPHNAARFSSEEEAAASLFGVAPKVFSNVDARIGLIEAAEGGVLFLDEIHNLPTRVQRSLLRVIEDGQFARIGEVVTRKSEVRFVFAGNAPSPDFGLAPDLLARLRVVRVPPLCERSADIPTLFIHLLHIALSRQNMNVDTVSPHLKGDHFESLCLDSFQGDNVRGLIDLADRISTKIVSGIDPKDAVASVFSERFLDSNTGASPRLSGVVSKKTLDGREGIRRGGVASNYESHRDIIVAAYRECDGNLSATVRLLTERGIRCSRRWLAIFLDKWEVR